MALVRNNVNFTPGAISSRTPVVRTYGNGRSVLEISGADTVGSAPRRPPWK